MRRIADRDAVILHIDGERRVVQVAIFLTKIIADHTIDDEDARSCWRVR